MARLGTVAAIVGVVAGAWNIFAYFQTCRGPNVQCAFQQAAPEGTEGTIVLVIAAALVVGSLAAILAPASIFYFLAALGLAIDAIELFDYSAIAPGSLYVTLILATLVVVLSVLIATRRTAVSEQSHPMNLPVFG